MTNKDKPSFHILRNDSTTHGGYHTGTLSLSNLSSVLVDQERAKIDLGLIHGKSAVERGIKFMKEKDEVPNPSPYWVIWVVVDRDEQGPYYAGISACSMLIDIENRRGWKNLAEHVNLMDAALKKKVKLDLLPAPQRNILSEFLATYNPEMWENSKEELKSALAQA